MPEESYSLYELNSRVRQVLAQGMGGDCWLHAELSEVRANVGGHCFVEFVQKDPHGNQLLAKARGTIWANVFRLLKPYFEQETGQAFVAGIKVRVQVAGNGAGVRGRHQSAGAGAGGFP